MTDGEWPEPIATRPLWLVTLADLALLLVGFFVLIQASRTDSRALAQSVRRGFAPVAMPEEPPLPVAANRLTGFAPGSATLPPATQEMIDWARTQLRDPRVRLTVTGSAGAEAGDVDPGTRSAVVLAADRARALAIRLTAEAPQRIAIATDAGPAGVTVSLAFAGETPQPDYRP